MRVCIFDFSKCELLCHVSVTTLLPLASPSPSPPSSLSHIRAKTSQKNEDEWNFQRNTQHFNHLIDLKCIGTVRLKSNWETERDFEIWKLYLCFVFVLLFLFCASIYLESWAPWNGKKLWHIIQNIFDGYFHFEMDQITLQNSSDWFCLCRQTSFHTRPICIF